MGGCSEVELIRCYDRGENVYAKENFVISEMCYLIVVV